MQKWQYMVAAVLTMIVSTARAESIAAVVDDVPISSFDVAARARLMMLQEGREGEKASAEQKKAALEALIEDQIKRQAAEQQGIHVSKDEVARAVRHLEQQNRMAEGGFKAVLARNNIPESVFENQIRADLGWLQVMQRQGKGVTVRPEDIVARQAMIRKELAQESLHFAEIVLPDEETALGVAAELANGVAFRTLAETKSIADTRSRGGEVRDATRFYYGAEVAPILAQMAPGQLSRPIKVPQGYALVLMIGRRDAITTDTVTVWDLMQAVVAPDSPVVQVLTPNFSGGCEAFAMAVSKTAVPGTMQRGQVSPTQVPSELKAVLTEAAFEKPVGPVMTPAGALYLMKCGESVERVVPDEAELREQIEMEQMGRLSQQLLAEVRRDAVIEYK